MISSLVWSGHLSSTTRSNPTTLLSFFFPPFIRSITRPCLTISVHALSLFLSLFLCALAQLCVNPTAETRIGSRHQQCSSTHPGLDGNNSRISSFPNSSHIIEKRRRLCFFFLFSALRMYHPHPIQPIHPIYPSTYLSFLTRNTPQKTHSPPIVKYKKFIFKHIVVNAKGHMGG